MECYTFSPYTPFGSGPSNTKEEIWVADKKMQACDYPSSLSTTLHPFIATQTPSYPPQLKSDSEWFESFFNPNRLYTDETTLGSFDYPTKCESPLTEDTFSVKGMPSYSPLLESNSGFLDLLLNSNLESFDVMPSEISYPLTSSPGNCSSPDITGRLEEVCDKISEPELSIPPSPLNSKKIREKGLKKRRRPTNSVDSISPSSPCKKKQKTSSVQLSKEERRAQRLVKNRESAQKSRERKSALFNEYASSHEALVAKIKKFAQIYKFAHPEIDIPSSPTKSKLSSSQDIKLESEFIMKWITKFTDDAIT